MRHLIDIKDFSEQELCKILDTADDIIANREKYREVCKYKKLATLFYEPSTRTRLSFESAMLELGGSVIGFSEPKASSVSKGESLQDTIRTVGCYADIIAMRHPKEGAPILAAQKSIVPIINAGDGGHAHPTQTLTDLLTIRREKKRLDNLTIGLCGDLKFGRTVHSLINAFTYYSGIKYVLIAPAELRLPEYVKNGVLDKYHIQYRETNDLEGAIPELDVLYMTRIQRERFLDEEEYKRLENSFILDRNKWKNAKEDAIIMHPLPRVNEISTQLDDDPRAAYFRQVENGKFVRMALIKTLLEEV